MLRYCCFYVNRHSYKLSYARELSCQITAKYVVGSHVSSQKNYLKGSYRYKLVFLIWYKRSVEQPLRNK